MLFYCCTLLTPVGQIISVQCLVMKFFFLYQEINVFSESAPFCHLGCFLLNYSYVDFRIQILKPAAYDLAYQY